MAGWAGEKGKIERRYRPVAKAGGEIADAG